MATDFHFQHLAPNGQCEPESFKSVRNAGRETESAVIITQAGEPIDEYHPHATHGSDVATVFHVARDVT